MKKKITKKGNIKKYALGGLEMMLLEKFMEKNNDDKPIVTSENPPGMSDPLQVQSNAPVSDNPLNTGTQQPIQTGDKNTLTIGVAPLLQGANLLATNIRNNQIKKREMEMLRNQLSSTKSPTNFSGDDDMTMYGAGGSVRKSKIVVDEGTTIPEIDMVSNRYTPIRPLSMYKSSGVPAPQFGEIPVPTSTNTARSITFERLKDSSNRNLYSPIFHGNYTPSQIRDELAGLPDEFGGVPVVKSPDLYNELLTTSNINMGKKTVDNMVARAYAKGGKVSDNYNTNPNNANALVEGGEFMLLPDGTTDSIIGDKHSDPSGGEYMNLPLGTRIYSDQLKVDKEFASQLTNKKTKSMTISKLAKKFDTSVEDEIIMSPTSSLISKRTAELNKVAKEQKLDALFDYQESQKPGTPTKKFAKGGKALEKAGGLAKDFSKGVVNAISSIPEFIPEISATLQNLTDFPIMTAKYQPKYLSRPQQLNIQDSLNRNASQLKPFLDANSGSASIDSARALQALAATQSADNEMFTRKYNVDSQNKQYVDQYNTQIANQAEQINLGRLDDYWNKVTQRQANKDMSTQNIIESAYQKAKGIQYDKRSLDIMNQIYPNVQYDPVTGIQYRDTGNRYFSPTQYTSGSYVDPNDNLETTITETRDATGKKKFTRKMKEKK